MIGKVSMSEAACRACGRQRLTLAYAPWSELVIACRACKTIRPVTEAAAAACTVEHAEAQGLPKQRGTTNGQQAAPAVPDVATYEAGTRERMAPDLTEEPRVPDVPPVAQPGEQMFDLGAEPGAEPTAASEQASTLSSAAAAEHKRQSRQRARKPAE